MTDAERQHLREHFLEPETRCDFFVDEKRKKLWKCMLDMLEILDRTCKEHELRYFLFYGSLLGAIRHKGFIPWDDDLDIVMPRPDFDRIQKILEKELEPPYFLQNFKTDPGYAPAFFKIRNSATAAITPWFTDNHLVTNLGIFIDIHSIDGFPESKLGKRAMSIARQVLKAAMYGKTGWPMPDVGRWKKRIGLPFGKMLGRHTLFSLSSRLPRAHTLCGSKTCAISPVFYGYDPPQHNYPAIWFAETEIADFEYLQVPVPRQYDALLTAEYGDWHKFVRGTEGGTRHDWMRFDTERDYKTVLIEEFGYKPEEMPLHSDFRHE
ncbi:MAG: LicD family protein [Kiritimatiellae bacterium]|nr:LicD family protein [Kiritimatiellia bacterium]